MNGQFVSSWGFNSDEILSNSKIQVICGWFPEVTVPNGFDKVRVFI